MEYALSYKEILRLRVMNVSYLNECIRFELNIELYRTPSQTQDEFDKFTDNLELNLDLAVKSNPYLVVVLGDFNAKLKNWYGRDKTNFQGNALETLFSQFGLNQITRLIYQILLLNVLISCLHPNLIWL